MGVKGGSSDGKFVGGKLRREIFVNIAYFGIMIVFKGNLISKNLIFMQIV